MKKVIFILMVFPFLFQAQTDSLQIQRTINENSELVEQFAQLLPMGINPYLTVFLTSVCSKFGFHNDYVATNPFFDSWIVLVLFGILFLFTALVGTVFKTNKVTATIGLVDTYLSNKAALIVNIIIILVPIFFSNESINDEIIYQAGFLTISLKTLLILIISIYFLIVVMAIKFLIEILIYFSPIPFIDSILEIFKIVISVIFIITSILNPAASVAVALMIFLISLFFCKRAFKLISKAKYLFVYPLLNLYRSKEKKLKDDEVFSILVLTNSRVGKLKKGIIVRLQETNSKFYLIQRRFLLSNVIQEIDLKAFNFNQNHLHTIISNYDNSKSIVLNRSYNKYLTEFSEKFNIDIGKRRELHLNLSILKKLKTFFNKNNIDEFKSIINN
jgi:hypothetical protein